MKLSIFSLAFSILLIAGICSAEKSAVDVAVDIFKTCLKDFETSCIKPKALSWLNKAMQQDEIKITNDLTIIRTGEDEGFNFDKQQLRSGKNINALVLLDKIDSFLTTHSLKINAPELFKSPEARSFIPDSYLQDGLARGLQVPLSNGNAVEGRGFVKRVMMPFLIGLKFKTTVLVPLALSLIALKTWKAMTLGLLSVVLSGALVIFKLAKPKLAHYEVVHYPHHRHVEHHVDHILPHHIEHVVPHHIERVVPHHIEHIVPHHIEHIEHVPHHIEHHEHHIDHHPNHIEHIQHHEHVPHHEHIEWARSSNNGQPQDAQEIAYRGQIPNQ